MAELKPCPFCGSNKLKIEHKSTSIYKANLIGVDACTFSVRCNKCHARGATVTGYLRNAFYALTEEAQKVLATQELLENRAAEAWNRRTDQMHVIDDVSMWEEI